MPIPSDFNECVRHFIHKGKPTKQAVAICYSVRRQRDKDNAGRATKKVLKEK